MDKKSSVWINTECWSFWQAKCWTWKEKETTIINSVISNHVNYICILVALNAPNNHIHSQIKEWLTDLRLKSQSTIMKMSAVRNWQRCVLWNKPQFNISTRKQKRTKENRENDSVRWLSMCNTHSCTHFLYLERIFIPISIRLISINQLFGPFTHDQNGHEHKNTKKRRMKERTNGDE